MKITDYRARINKAKGCDVEFDFSDGSTARGWIFPVDCTITGRKFSGQIYTFTSEPIPKSEFEDHLPRRTFMLYGNHRGKEQEIYKAWRDFVCSS